MIQAERMERALRAAGGEVERLALKGHDHFAAGHAAGEAEGPWLPRAVNWMSRYLHSFAYNKACHEQRNPQAQGSASAAKLGGVHSFASNKACVSVVTSN